MTNLLKASVKDHPNLQRIWGDLYKVRVPLIYSMSEEDIRTRGLPSSGNEDIDKTMHYEPSITYKTIDQTFEIYRAGGSVSIVDYDDTKHFYEAIQEHLETWLRFMQYGIHLHQIPFDDLLELDTFANIVYDKAKFVFNPLAIRELNSSWNTLGIDLSPSAFMNAKGSVRFFHLMKSETDRNTEKGYDRRQHLERASLSEDLIRMADRYDRRPREELTTSLRFGNDREWT